MKTIILLVLILLPCIATAQIKIYEYKWILDTAEFTEHSGSTEKGLTVTISYTQKIFNQIVGDYATLPETREAIRDSSQKVRQYHELRRLYFYLVESNITGLLLERHGMLLVSNKSPMYDFIFIKIVRGRDSISFLKNFYRGTGYTTSGYYFNEKRVNMTQMDIYFTPNDRVLNFFVDFFLW